MRRKAKPAARVSIIVYKLYAGSKFLGWVADVRLPGMNLWEEIRGEGHPAGLIVRDTKVEIIEYAKDYLTKKRIAWDAETEDE